MKQALNELSKNFLTQETKSLSWRLKNLKALKSILQEYDQKMNQAKKKDLGIHHYQSFLACNLLHFAHIDLVLKNLSSWMGEKSCETPVLIFPGKVYYKIEPLGPTLILGSWNYPFSTCIMPLITAIAAGNSCVVKPSEVSENCS